ncbi:MAG: hypothetical protein GX607_18040 [Myxococcales bacterium]|nr:hypothetical protein [Myxococcales bacterium]
MDRSSQPRRSEGKMARNVEERREPCPEPAPLEGQPLGPADNKPSQAEGDRETVEEDLRIQEERESGKSR